MNNKKVSIDDNKEILEWVNNDPLVKFMVKTMMESPERTKRALDQFYNVIVPEMGIEVKRRSK